MKTRAPNLIEIFKCFYIFFTKPHLRDKPNLIKMIAMKGKIF